MGSTFVSLAQELLRFFPIDARLAENYRVSSDFTASIFFQSKRLKLRLYMNTSVLVLALPGASPLLAAELLQSWGSITSMAKLCISSMWLLLSGSAIDLLELLKIEEEMLSAQSRKTTSTTNHFCHICTRCVTRECLSIQVHEQKNHPLSASSLMELFPHRERERMIAHISNPSKHKIILIAKLIAFLRLQKR
ncbi:hypothetical protein YC2023_025974 [Brassica napus]